MNEKIVFTEKDFKHEFTETSTENICYPKYREKYITQTEKYIKKVLDLKSLECKIDYENHTITVSTSKKTRDPIFYLKGLDFIKYVCRGVSVEEAMKIMDDDCYGDIINLRELSKTDKIFEKRKSRLIGKDETTIKAIKLLTGCYIFIHGKTAVIIGPFKGIEEAKEIIVNCMFNIHPIFEIKKLIEKRKLAKDASKANENWDRFLPKIEKTHSKSRKTKKKKEEGPLVNIQKSKEDIKLETGEYFIKDMKDEKNKNKTGKTREEIKEEKEKKRKDKELKYVVPEE